MQKKDAMYPRDGTDTNYPNLIMFEMFRQEKLRIP